MNQYSEKPDIMAIGDSMYQGIHSLSMPPWMAEHSAPAQVARALGMKMVVPDLSQPLLWDIVKELRGGGIAGIVKNMPAICRSNLLHWQPGQPWSAHEAFDNVAIGGAVIKELWTLTYDSKWQEFLRLSDEFRNNDVSFVSDSNKFIDLWFALSACYTLNPRHRPEQGGLSQLDQAIQRAPRILLINIGSNEGLFNACFMGDIRFTTQADIKTMAETEAKINGLVTELADRLKALPNRVEKIVFNGMIRPRFVPNLMPDHTQDNIFPGDEYFPAYGSRLTGTQTPVSGDSLRQYDEMIARINARSDETLRTALGNRAVFADLYPACPPLDGKHYHRHGIKIEDPDITIDNRPITPTPFGFHGGFTSLDNMHPTIPGYAMMADVVLKALGRNDLTTNKSAAFQADNLLNDFPGWKVFTAQVLIPFLASLATQFVRR